MFKLKRELSAEGAKDDPQKRNKADVRQQSKAAKT